MAGAGCHHFRCFLAEWAGAQCAVCHSAGADGFFTGGAAPGQVESALGFDVSNYHLFAVRFTAGLLQNFLPILFCDFYGKRGPGGSVLEGCPVCHWEKPVSPSAPGSAAGACGSVWQAHLELPRQGQLEGLCLPGGTGSAVLFRCDLAASPLGHRRGVSLRDVSQCERSQRICGPAGAWDGVRPGCEMDGDRRGRLRLSGFAGVYRACPHRGETRPNDGPGISGDGGTASGHQSQCAGNRL